MPTYASETVSPIAGHPIQRFLAGVSVASTCIKDEQRAGPAIDRASEEGSTIERYGTVAMDYIQLGDFERSGEGAGSRCSNVEDDNRVLSNLARRTGVSKAGKKLPACGLGRASFGARQH